MNFKFIFIIKYISFEKFKTIDLNKFINFKSIYLFFIVNLVLLLMMSISIFGV